MANDFYPFLSYFGKPMASKKPLTLLVTTLKSENYLGEFLTNILGLSDFFNLEVIVVANSSNDKEKYFLKKIWV